MRFLAIIVGGASVAAWTYLAMFHGRFWMLRGSREPIARPGKQDPCRASQRRVEGDMRTAEARAMVVAVVPARNEADVIARSVASLLAQDEVARLVLVDDNSTDRTVQAARSAALASGRADKLTVLSGAALPQGWSGKVWAMRQGVEAALALRPQYLLLTDADIVHDAGSVAALVAIARQGKRALVSLMAKLHCESAVEKLLIPAFVFFFFKLYPPRWIAENRRATAGAAGGCMLVTPEALARAGGMEAIRAEVIDDCALARAVRQSGGSIELRLSEQVRSERPYSAVDIGRMISRSAFNQLRHSTRLLAGSFAGLAVLYVVPPLLLLTGPASGRVLGAVAWSLMTMCYLPMVRFYGLSAWWAMSLPAAAIFYMGATLHSAVSFWRGAGGRWKGRVQDPRVPDPGFHRAG